jgi:hypothetical protein
LRAHASWLQQRAQARDHRADRERLRNHGPRSDPGLEQRLEPDRPHRRDRADRRVRRVGRVRRGRHHGRAPDHRRRRAGDDRLRRVARRPRRRRLHRRGQRRRRHPTVQLERRGPARRPRPDRRRPASSPIATIVGVPQVAGDFAVTLSVLDGDGLEAEAECGALTIGEPAKLDPDALLENFPDGCISFGVTVDDLEQMGVLAGGDGSPPTCSLVPGRGNGSQNFDLDLDTDDTFPPGIDVDPDTCELLGAINPTVSPGIHAWIVTLEQGGATVHLPYCAAQKVQPPAAYDVEREDSGAPATFVPGVVQLLPGSDQFSYGSDAPDPRLIVTDDVGACVGNTCFYSFIYTYNALSPVATVSANPNAKFPAQGFDGFTHAIRISESDPALFATFRDRPFVVNVQFEYCIADNGLDCGNNEADPNKRRELIRANGGGSRYAFSLIVLPG